MTEVRTERIGSTLLITIDRPQARNAVNAAVAAGLAAALDELESDPTLRAGVLTGAENTFSAGMDLKAALKGESPEIRGRGFGGLTEAELTKPLIAAVEGFAMGGGFELALGCDLIVAGETAQFGLPEVKRGLIAAGGGVIRLPKRIPHHLAMEFLLTGEPVTGRRAGELGLVNRVTADGDAAAVAVGLAEKLAENAPLALAAVKKIVRGSEAEAFAVQREETKKLMQSNDVREGMTAFAERRAPKWTGE
ncbi:enoyl-CoA hydratase [Amycolatopsis mediterranei S699]|uniref:Enoyl-CoA hydratase n=2 Tax=Amycolatopsis mediterranei TaxID=33910 RepID=A0A0H3DBR3_AMYMU|nr:crotonase/enoyl-CoA hydratase family protein [Amycolatopsis mediterranei]ADJ48101.1 enoyl-CoA hydratase [Amycolatopsis mediterranei U32]AEK45002.1 enoyl-CoA hydratase [Amycolatopsis mediterranei S699]AFO79812.1 enoyl-CoA hydratase [Amycolatopsis mediterranei S699]AGT86940.1 enoyl-CoA hydratase [Amycolatopsis mediterranei RB]KDO10586.1 enoyl-CoA hydratase [Amycolatopsis mediterranei]